MESPFLTTKEPLVLSVKEAADLLRVSEYVIRDMAASGQIPAIIGGTEKKRLIRIKRIPFMRQLGAEDQAGEVASC